MKEGATVREATNPHAARRGTVIVVKLNPEFVVVRWNDGEERVEHVSTLREL